MNLLHPKDIDSLITVLLAGGEMSTTTLLEKVRLSRKKTTKQGFYAALRKLKKEETVVVYKGKAALHTSWIKEMRDTFEEISKTYTVSNDSFDVLSLNDKESVSYVFSTVKNLDIFWGHSQNIFCSNTPSHDALYTYDPHYWFYIARKESERKLLKSIIQSKRQFLMTVGGATRLDKIIKTDFHSHYLQYNVQKQFDKPNYYITVIGDFITEAYIDPSISKKIEALYQKYSEINHDLLDEFQKILDSKGKNKIKITKNKSKALMLKKKMGKNFYILNLK